MVYTRCSACHGEGTYRLPPEMVPNTHDPVYLSDYNLEVREIVCPLCEGVGILEVSNVKKMPKDAAASIKQSLNQYGVVYVLVETEKTE